MVQTTNWFFDEVARLMNDAAGVAQGVRREFETLFRTQAEKWLRDLDLVKRDEFEAVKDMARIAREENETLKAACGRARGSRWGPRPVVLANAAAHHSLFFKPCAAISAASALATAPLEALRGFLA